MTFTEFPLHDSILTAIAEMGFETPTPVQEAVIPAILENDQDIVALAQTGTGKTAAFGLPLLEKLRDNPRETGALVLCPTRELAIQITKELQSYSANLPKVAIDVVYGGAGYGEQIRSLKRGLHILVATPGRLLDLINKGKADLSMLEYVILDEADIMLNMGFKEELDAILEAAPAERRTILLSATMPQEVARIAENYMNDPQTMTMGRRNAAAESVDHTYFLVRGNEKYAALKRLVDFHPDMYGIVFCRTKASTQEIADQLGADGYDAEALHGDLSQSQREFVMNKFRRKDLQLLVATDIAARGLDVQNLSHVIHYDLPDEIEMYTHRSGRTGRAGKSGNSYAIVGAREKRRLQHIEKVIKRDIQAGKIPGEEDIFKRQLLDFAERLKLTEVNEEQIAPYLAALQEELADVSHEELLQKIVSLQFEKMLGYYDDMPDLTPVHEKEFSKNDRRSDRGGQRGGKYSDGRRGGQDRGGSRGGRSDGVEAGFVKVSLNLGKRDRVAPPQLIGLVNQSTRNRDINIGRIKVDTSWSDLQIEEAYATEVAHALNGFTYEGRTLTAKLGGSDSGSGAGRGAKGRGYSGSKAYSGPGGKPGRPGPKAGGKKYGGKTGKKSGTVRYAKKKAQD